ncbi:hypothetical protein L226DRAFT_386780 [Lentinus tigrinus ALCF2SS1-7]|uniref:Uncharacterized protein n=1 Tax=Lentinus tigrinus ALCF2SS1-6 TaxID=1328759 RepID=A0A5C2SB33_9APHY|nr:hypothetical protein L227DRAFT_88242 [Lentinus tigrinus ALCF2SS1-6]RPD75730.1 hypothetical protein L226DRAFT_386780 [Lentinus tigrinus ALCF2SS1-7]
MTKLGIQCTQHRTSTNTTRPLFYERQLRSHSPPSSEKPAIVSRRSGILKVHPINATTNIVTSPLSTRSPGRRTRFPPSSSVRSTRSSRATNSDPARPPTTARSRAPTCATSSPRGTACSCNGATSSFQGRQRFDDVPLSVHSAAAGLLPAPSWGTQLGTLERGKSFGSSM